MYQPNTEADWKRFVRDAILQETLFFQSDDPCALGIPVVDAFKKHGAWLKLKDGDDRMLERGGSAMAIRIQARTP